MFIFYVKKQSILKERVESLQLMRVFVSMDRFSISKFLKFYSIPTYFDICFLAEIDVKVCCFS